MCKTNKNVIPKNNMKPMEAATKQKQEQKLIKPL